MKNFDLQRFSRVLRLDLVQGRGVLLWSSLGLLALYLFFFWFSHNIGLKADVVNDLEGYLGSICQSVAISSIVTMYVFALAAACTVYKAEQKKSRRTAHLMLPATSLEKFLARWVFLLVFSVVAGVLTFFVADAVHIAWLWLSGKPVVAASTYFWHFISQSEDMNKIQGLNSLTVYTMLLTIHAFFLLGGIVFRKYQFVATTLAFVVVLGTFGYFTAKEQPYMWQSDENYYLGMSLIYIALVCVFTVLAYRLYRRWQVVTRNFVNLP